jgi:hypothetical protein
VCVVERREDRLEWRRWRGRGESRGNYCVHMLVLWKALVLMDGIGHLIELPPPSFQPVDTCLISASTNILHYCVHMLVPKETCMTCPGLASSRSSTNCPSYIYIYSILLAAHRPVSIWHDSHKSTPCMTNLLFDPLHFDESKNEMHSKMFS